MLDDAQRLRLLHVLDTIRAEIVVLERTPPDPADRRADRLEQLRSDLEAVLRLVSRKPS